LTNIKTIRQKAQEDKDRMEWLIIELHGKLKKNTRHVEQRLELGEESQIKTL